MASTLCQKWLITFFFQKAQNFVQFRPYDCIQISPAFGPNTLQIMQSFEIHRSAGVPFPERKKNGWQKKLEYLEKKILRKRKEGKCRWNADFVP